MEHGPGDRKEENTILLWSADQKRENTLESTILSPAASTGKRQQNKNLQTGGD
jgi:hypothetical protein